MTQHKAGDGKTLPMGITMGCPVGIGPEIVLRLLSRPGPHHDLQPLVIGDAGVLRRCADSLGLPVRIAEWEEHVSAGPGIVRVLSLSDLGGNLRWGRPDGETGRAMGRYVEEATRLALQGRLAGVVTCPISKKALQAGGYPFPGHTEMLAQLCGTEDLAMMRAGRQLRVTLVTIHRALARVPAAISKEAVFRMIAMTGRSLRCDFGLPEPRLAVAGLNPHAGEEGMFGDEEKEAIAPAVAAARAQGWLVTGPLPPDTVFHRAAAGHFDAVVCMYHDQGLIPFKLLHFSDGVNVTLGLPIVRTSVDHGTAYDIAGKGLADPASLTAAFFLAAEIAGNRRAAAAASLC